MILFLLIAAAILTENVINYYSNDPCIEVFDRVYRCENENEVCYISRDGNSIDCKVKEEEWENYEI